MLSELSVDVFSQEGLSGRLMERSSQSLESQ